MTAREATEILNKYKDTPLQDVPKDHLVSLTKAIIWVSENTLVGRQGTIMMLMPPTLPKRVGKFQDFRDLVVRTFQEEGKVFYVENEAYNEWIPVNPMTADLCPECKGEVKEEETCPKCWGSGLTPMVNISVLKEVYDECS